MVEAGKSGRNAMSVAIGVSRNRENWTTCLMEKGQVLEFHTFIDPAAASTYLEHTCVLYPEPNIVVSAEINARFTRLVDLSHDCLEETIAGNYAAEEQEKLKSFLIAVSCSNVDSYLAPSVKFLSSVPLHRKLMRENLGTSNNLCAISALLLQLRAREAAWSEMNLMYLEVDNDYWSILVAHDGWVVNGMTKVASVEKHIAEVAEQAYWEGLHQELAGLLAVHHFEEIVVAGRLKDAFIERFSDFYQVYLFPYTQPEFEGYEAALGAATIAEGLYGYGTSAEIVERLQIREAKSDLNDGAGAVPVKDTTPAPESDEYLADMPA